MVGIAIELAIAASTFHGGTRVSTRSLDSPFILPLALEGVLAPGYWVKIRKRLHKQARTRGTFHKPP